MPINNLTHFVLVDFENVPGIDLSVLGDAPMTVVLFLGVKSKLKPALVDQITTLPFEVRLIKVSQMKRNALDFVLAYHLGEMVTRYPRGHYYIISGDQDFEPLITHLREHSLHIAQHGALTDLPFLASPKTVTPVVKAVKVKPAPAGHSVLPAIAPTKPPVVPKPKKTAGTKPPIAVKPPTALAAPKAKPAPVKAKVVADKYERLLEQIKRGKHRPGTRAKLMHHIHTVYGQKSSPEQLDTVVQRLIGDSLISIDGQDKVSYL